MLFLPFLYSTERFRYLYDRDETTKRLDNKKQAVGLFERWITLSTGKITIQQIAWFVLSTLIHWIAIYPVK